MERARGNAVSGSGERGMAYRMTSIFLQLTFETNNRTNR